jgi:hypothetical protein
MRSYQEVVQSLSDEYLLLELRHSIVESTICGNETPEHVAAENKIKICETEILRRLS